MGPSSTALLLHNTTATSGRSSTAILFSLLASSTAAAFAFAFLLSATSPSPALPGPIVLLVSLDGFRFGYHLKSPTPNIRRLIAGGTVAAEGLIPVFPTLTFPNHYSIVTGLYPPYHGIINNYFVDPDSGKLFTTRSHEAHWWLGEPLWETAARNGLNAAAYFWAGSEVIKGNWTCPPQFCPKYNGSVPFEQRVDTVLSYFDLPASEIPSFIALYFEDPDRQGHQVGPDHPQITSAVAHMDQVLGRLITGLEERGIFEGINLILVGDHGMVGTCDKKLVFLEDLSPWIQIPTSWIHSLSPLLAIRPPADVSPDEVVAKMNEGLSSGKVPNGEYLRMFVKEESPRRLHYSESDRIPPVIGLVGEGYNVEQTRTGRCECGGAHGYEGYNVEQTWTGRCECGGAHGYEGYNVEQTRTGRCECGGAHGYEGYNVEQARTGRCECGGAHGYEGYNVEQTRTGRCECGGAHGYDNAFFSMRIIFIACGPRFAKRREVVSFQNVEIYNLVIGILGIEGAPNNGSASFVDSILL